MKRDAGFHRPHAALKGRSDSFPHRRRRSCLRGEARAVSYVVDAGRLAYNHVDDRRPAAVEGLFQRAGQIKRVSYLNAKGAESAGDSAVINVRRTLTPSDGRPGSCGPCRGPSRS